jgi:NodT family efflux transporter outer membrane factor (OMF) lipoprotein
MRRLALVMAAVAAAALAACSIGPDYERPPAPSTDAFKELDGWKPATPREAASGSAWWSIYDDPALDGLERQVEISNQTLKASEAAFRQASAVVEEGRAGFFPTVSATAAAQRSGSALRTSGISSIRSGGSSGGRITQNQFSVSPTASWVPDLWGRIRRTVEADVANAQASAADLAAARLAAQATLASDYFQLRVADEQQRVLEATVAAFQRSLDIARNQFEAGFVAETDVVTAETQLQNAQAQRIALGVQRTALEHAIAVLTGKPPAELALAPAPMATSVPVVPAGVPTELLERRPDIAAAERAMAAANAQIGVAETAYFPDLTLSATLGFTSAMLGNLLSVSNSAWTLGAQASETIFDGGLRTAQVAAARAVYDQNVANYREAVLTAFQQVEDQLSALRILEQQADAQAVALQSARRAVELALNQYQAGTVAYTNVVVAQATALADEQTALAILQSRLVASAALVEALGGGWDRAQLPAMGTAAR